MPPTLDILEDVVRREYDAQERRADSLDTKAGLVLGFAGLLVSLTPDTVWAPFALLARLLAATAVLVVLRVFAVAPPRPEIDRVLRAPDDAAARALLVGSLLHTQRLGWARTTEKAWRIRAAVRLVTAAVVTMVAGAAVDTIGRWSGW